jgi:hypothetical protein
LNEKLLHVFLQSSSGAAFYATTATRQAPEPQLSEGETDDPNEGVTVLAIDIPDGNQTISVIFAPALEENSLQDQMLPSMTRLDEWDAVFT